LNGSLQQRGGRGTPIDPLEAAKLMRLEAADGPAFEVPVETQWLDEAVDEAVFADQRQIEEREHKHFKEAIGEIKGYQSPSTSF
jgi:hypothetical protein